MVEFWVEGGQGFYLIGGDNIEWVRKTSKLTVTFTNEDCYNHFNQIGDDPDPPTKTGMASFVLKRFPAD